MMRMNIQSAAKDMGLIHSTIYSMPSLLAMIKKMTGQSEESFILEKEVKAQGWKPFESRIAAFYLEKKMRGEYPKKEDTKILKEILEFEDQLSSFSIAGYSRSFQLGMYYKLWSIESKDLDASFQGNPMIGKEHTLELIRLTGSRVLQVDYLYIVLQHLGTYLGVDKVKYHLENGEDYFSLYDLLDRDLKESLIHNLLTYSASIDDKEFFLPLEL